MTLYNLLKKENNNLDIFRVIAALAVIYGHAYSLTPDAGKKDFLFVLTSHEDSSAFAVKIFFFLSGLVVTNSLLEKKKILPFIIARFFRIWPALIITVLISSLILGPILSNLSLQDYFSSPQPYWYIYNNIKLSTDFNLPGVFIDNPYKNTVNGSLWTIPYEIAAYSVLLALYNLQIFKFKSLSIIILLLIFLDLINGANWLFMGNMLVGKMFFCFSLGSVFATYKSHIQIHLSMTLSIWILYYIFRGIPYDLAIFYLASFMTILHISSLNILVKYKLKFDISYGIYLWGFPIQQIMAKYFSDYGIRFHQISSMIIVCILGYISWQYIEKRGIQAGQIIANIFTKTRI